jgi:hypothetical protein
MIKSEDINELIVKRKVHISTVGWIAAILSGLIIYFTAFDIMGIVLFNQNPDTQRLLSLSDEFRGNMKSIQNSILLTQCLLIIVALFFLFSAIGLICYKQWARKIFVTSGWVFIVLSFVGLLIYGFIFSKFTSDLLPLKFKDNWVTESGGTPAIFKTWIKIKILSYSIILVLVIRALFRICLDFRKPEYKKIFI